MRFTITWRDGAYKVNVPEYDGGEVVTADEHDAVVGMLREMMQDADPADWPDSVVEWAEANR